MKRVMIVGGPGSGKSTLARILGERTGLPVFHMDLIHWKEDWVERPRPERAVLAAEVEAQDNWIFEGGLSATYDNRMRRADTLIWLDLPVALRLWRVVKRLFRHLGQARPDLPTGCVERLHPETVAFLWFIWTSRNTSRARIEKRVAPAPSHLRVVHLCNPDEVRAWLDGLDGKILAD